MGELQFKIPLDSYERINSAYGDRIHPISKTKKFHSGIDYKVPTGTSVKASESGVVVRASAHDKLGELIIINHTPKAKSSERHLYTLYGHLNSYSVCNGEKIEQHSVIASSGDTGASTGPHLHFSIIDSSTRLSFHSYGAVGYEPTSSLFKNPENYYGRIIKIHGTLFDITDEEKSKIANRLEVTPFVDYESGAWWLTVTLCGKNIGKIDKYTSEIRLKLSHREIEDILKQPSLNLGANKEICEIKFLSD